MKPDFALDFRDNQIALLHRQEVGWAVIGRVAVDDPDLDAAMGYLRATALGLSPRGIATKLILPNEAILYTTLDGVPFGPAQRSAHIAGALVGRTPYDVADLVYDWTDAGKSAHVAVIARETLAEAEDFAAQHRFNPVSFAALPDEGAFEGEVWFGTTQLAETLLQGGEVVERDDVTLLAPPVPAAQAPLDASDFEMGENHPDQGVDVDEAAVSEQADDALTQDLAAAEDGAAAMPDAGVADAPQALVVAPDDTLDNTASPQDSVPDMADASEARADAREVWQDFIAPDAPDPAPEGAESMARAAQTKPLDAEPAGDDPAQDFASVYSDTPDAPIDEQQSAAPADEAPMALDVPLIDEDAPELRAPQRMPAEKPVGKAEGLLAAFAARRAAAIAKAEAVTNTAPRKEPSLTTAQPDMPLTEANAPAAQGEEAEASTTHAQTPALIGDIAPAPGAEAPAADSADIVPPAPAPNPPKLGAAGDLVGDPKLASLGPADANGASLGKIVPIKVAAGALAAGKPAPVKHVPAKDIPAKPQDLNAMPKAKAGKGGFWLGWILTAALLISLAAAAALSTYLLDAWNSLYAPETQVVVAETPRDAAPKAETETETQAGSDDPAPTASLPAVDAPTAATQTLGLSRGTQTEAGTPTLPSADPLVQSTMGNAATPAQAGLAAPALAQPSSQVASAAAAPAPQATSGNTADVGTVTPTANGARSAAGVMIYAGKPKLVPAARSAAAISAALAAAPIETAANPALAAARPAPRPDAVLAAAIAARPAATDPDAAVQPLGANLPAAADPALAGKRALPRPAGILAAGREARLASASASLVASASAPATIDPNRSPYAVAISRVPAPRPSGLRDAFVAAQRAAEEAALAAAAAPAQEPVAAANDQAASNEPAAVEADNEPEVTSAAGGTSARSVVAKQATVKNALNLNDINLVGIFGSKSNRYALIRQPSGRFKKLKVGDRFDGGEVAAITETEVRYAKDGQMLALQMPRG